MSHGQRLALIPETNHVPKEHNGAAILLLLFMAPISFGYYYYYHHHSHRRRWGMTVTNYKEH
jgi:hypothetical protein